MEFFNNLTQKQIYIIGGALLALIVITGVVYFLNRDGAEESDPDDTIITNEELEESVTGTKREEPLTKEEEEKLEENVREFEGTTTGTPKSNTGTSEDTNIGGTSGEQTSDRDSSDEFLNSTSGTTK